VAVRRSRHGGRNGHDPLETSRGCQGIAQGAVSSGEPSHRDEASRGGNEESFGINGWTPAPGEGRCKQVCQPGCRSCDRRCQRHCRQERLGCAGIGGPSEFGMLEPCWASGLREANKGHNRFPITARFAIDLHRDHGRQLLQKANGGRGKKGNRTTGRFRSCSNVRSNQKDLDLSEEANGSAKKERLI